MTVTLELSPDAESDLRDRAARRGQSVADYLLTLADAAEYADLSLSEEEVVVVEQGLAELHAGDKGISQEEFHAEMLATLVRLKQNEKVAA